ncbi:MAG TPA: peptide deformylase [Phycisphaerae bacterium]|nr:peptide deformylase [Phycisphaerae bacterium]
MKANAGIKQVDLSHLRVLHYPDPRLREVSAPVDEVDDDVRRLAERMFELMAAAPGVGLAASQVGVAVRLFVACPSGEPVDRRAYVNPRIVSAEGTQQEEEGCLSFPGITCKIRRFDVVTIRATGLDGKEFEETARQLAARVFQHEMDHLDGWLLVDRMGSLAKLTRRRALKDLEEKFAEANT